MTDSYRSIYGARIKADKADGLYIPRVSLDTALSAAVDSIDIPKLAAAVQAGDTMANPTTAPVLAHGALWNGTSWERAQSNVPLLLFGSSEKTASRDSADQALGSGRGVEVHINVSAINGTPSVVFTLQGKDPTSNTYFDILSTAAVTGAGFHRLIVYPGVAEVANEALSSLVPRIWRVHAEGPASGGMTYSVGAVVHV